MIIYCVFEFAVPPSTPVIYDDFGQEISSVLGPYTEGSDVRLSCRVAGGKFYMPLF
jgi:hypothetical protein